MTIAPSPYSQLWRWEVQQAIKDLIATGGGGGTGGGIPEAPNDGKVYGRSNTTWKDAWASAALTGTPTAPTMSAADSSTAIATTAYVNSKLGGYAPLVSPIFTGNPTGPTPAPGDNDTSLATTAFVAAAITASNAGGPWAPLASPALTGNPTSTTPPTADNDTSIATTAFVQANLASYAPLSSPVLTGNPTAPTPSPGDNDTSVATTAFVSAAITASNVGGPWAPLASPALTGNPTAPTALAGDNDTSIATTAFVSAAITASNAGGPWAPIASPTFTGDPKAPTPATADNDTSIATTAFVKAQAYAPLASPVLTGDPQAPTPATADNDTSIATTAFVKAQGYVTSSGVTSVTGTAPVVSSGGNTPAISMAAASATVPGFLTATDWATFNAKAPTASPTFTGTPTAPTPVIADNSTALATTAFVKSQAYITIASVPVASSTGPSMDGIAAVGTGTTWARADHVHPSDTTKLSDSPSDGQTYGRKNGAWVVAAGGVIIADVLPTTGIQQGQLAWESDTGNLFTYYTDVDSSQWVMVASATGGGGSTPASGRVPGEVATFAMATAPSGWLKCNGAVVSRTLYPALFTAIGTTYGAGDGSTTFSLPDLRGEFVRGWADDDTAADTGRAIGSWQADTFISHTHTQQGYFSTGTVSADHTHAQGGTWQSGGRSSGHLHNIGYTTTGQNAANWGCYGGGGFTNEVLIARGGTASGWDDREHVHSTGIGGSTGGISANHIHGVTISGETGAAGSAETRPRNVALLYCIKY